MVLKILEMQLMWRLLQCTVEFRYSLLPSWEIDKVVRVQIAED